jgi:hypothetical protein
MRGRLAAVAVFAGFVVAVPASAQAAAPFIQNNGGVNGTDTQWVEDQSLPDEDFGNRLIHVTFMVSHDVGRRITSVNGFGTTNRIVDAQYIPLGANNRLGTTLVRAQYDPGHPGGFSCPIIGSSTRRHDRSFSFSVSDDLGQVSQTLSQNVHWIETDQCTGADDYPALEQTSQNLTNVTPGQNVTFEYRCDDADQTGNNDRCDFVVTRWRRLDDGAISGETTRDAEDNTLRSFTQSFSERGVYVVEARLCSEDSCQDNSWWRIGSVLVNGAAAPTLSVSLPSSVNTGDAAVAQATVGSDDDGVPVIEWDAANDGTFETLHQIKPTLLAGNLVSSTVSGGQLQQTVNTSTHGTKTAVARIYDSGAFDAADNTRRSSTASDSVYVNARPVAAAGSRTIAEDSGPGTFSLSATDADNQPLPLSYDVVTSPTKGSLSCTSSGSCTYTPNANQSGTDSFTFTAKDGPSANAWATSNTATYTINITAVNDAPSLGDTTVFTNEDTPLTTTVSATDPDGPSLSYTKLSGPSNGTATCTTGGSCTYTPNANFNGTDSFGVQASDGAGGTDTGTVTVNVAPVNDAPVINDRSITTNEDTPVTFNHGAADVDGGSLAVTASDPPKGSASCTATQCTYTPDPNTNGSDSFTITASDGQLSDTAAISVTVNAVNDAPDALDTALTTDEDTTGTVSITAVDVDGDALTYTPTNGAHGQVTCGGNVCDYAPDANFFGSDSFAVTVADGHGGSDTITVTVTVNSVNDVPVAQDTSLTTDEDASITFTPSTSDVEDSTLTLTATNGSKGSVTCGVATCTYTPNANANGSDSFTYTATDDDGASDTATVGVTINAVNDEPVAQDASADTDEDTAVDVPITASDVDGDSLTYTPTNGAHGTVSCDGNVCTYTPAANFFGTDTFTVLVSDGAGGDDDSVVTVTIRSVNDAPVAQDTSITTDEDTPVTFTPPAEDVEDAALTFTATDGSKGSVSCGTATCTYTPDLNENGSDSFTYTATDDDGASDTATVSVTINPVNDAPDALDTALTTDEDTTGSVSITAVDVDGDALTYTPTDGANGQVTCDGNVCDYAPDANVFGSDSFTVTVTDTGGLSDTITVTVTVNSVNDVPVAQDTSLTTDEDTSITFTPPADDVEDAALTLTATDGSKGSVTCGVATCTYTPDLNENGSDSFTYTATDDDGASDTATVSVDITPVNDAPVAQDASADTDEDTAVDVPITASDVDGDSLTYTPTNGAHGTVSCDGNVCTYTPDADFNGTDTFTVLVSDGAGGGDDSIVTVTIRPVNDAPVAGDVAITTDEDTAFTSGFDVSDVDTGDTYTLSASDPGHGTVTCDGTLCEYSPDLNFNGTDTFEYTATDAAGAVGTATVTVTVTPVNDAPVAADSTESTDEDTALGVTLVATDVDTGDERTYAVVDGPGHGTVDCSSDGSCTYEPAANFHGSDSFTWKASDGDADSNVATVDITVRGVNDAPVAQDASAQTEEDTPVDVTIEASDVDIATDGDVLTATPGPAGHGTVTCDALTCTYTPAANFSGSDSFAVTVSDGNGGSDTVTVSITVDEVNDAPVADEVVVSTNEDTAVEFDVGGSDVDGDPLTFTVANGPGHGQVVCNSAGHCLYAPAANYHGTDSFAFTAHDGRGGTDTATATITVNSVNDAPTTPDGTAEVDEDATVEMTLPGSDIDGDALTYQRMSGPSHGTVTCTTSGTCTYSPAANYNGEDAFSYKATDPSGASSTGTITITVKPVNDAPTANDVSAHTEEDSPVDIALDGSDIDDTILTYSIPSGPSHGSLTCTGALCTYTPNENFFGVDSFTYKVTDAGGLSDTATVTITVAEILYDTEIEVGPVVRISQTPLQLKLLYQARLTRKIDDAPVAGRTITFVVGGQEACKAGTGSDGWARCGWSLSRTLSALLDNGYDGVFDGDSDYKPVSGHGTLIG